MPDDSISNPKQPNGPGFPVVGLGGSAGGLKPLLKFFEKMPAHNGMAFVVILHLSPTHTSNLDSILGGVTAMPVMAVTETVKIQPDHVYVISPTTNLKMYDGHLQVSAQGERPPRPVAIDLFFRTLADVHRERAMCVIMSGTGSDGAVGLSRIKERGGVVFAQSPDEAEYAAMPQNAIRTGMVDFVLTAAEIPGKVMSIAENSRYIMLPASEDIVAGVDPSAAAEEALRGVISILRTRTGHDFSHYKRATVLRRIERRMQVCQVKTLPQYLQHLLDHTAETAPLIGDMLIGVTNFFRDRAAFEALERNVIPKLFEGKKDDDEVRVWVAGCASGEEAYSIAILLAESAAALGRGNVLRVFASDIDDDAIARARRGLYPESIAADVTAARLDEFFVREGSGYCVSRRIRDMVLFANHDLIRDAPFSRMDLVSCRNVLIYLNRDIQAQVLAVLHFALRTEQWLFLGSAESVESAPELFELQDKKNHIAVAKPGRGDRRPINMQPGWSGPRSIGYTELASRNDRVMVNELHQRVLEQYAPPSVIVDQRYDIVHLSERAGRYLQIAGGQASLNLLKSVPVELRSPLRTLLFEATEHGTNVQASGVVVHREDGPRKLNLHVRPIPDSGFRGPFLLVLFEEAGIQEESAQEVTVPGHGTGTAQLEQELERAREQIQATIEKYEAQNEELTASNEELQALNEELRSTTEELETSKEELQSINEELLTVNQELKNKVEEAQHVNDDMENLIASIDIGVIFLDRELKIKRYTQRANEIFNIIESDVGRPLLDITHRLRYDQLAEDARNVFANTELSERELKRDDGRWFSTRMRPYRLGDGRVEGAVITFYDVTERKVIEERLHMAEVRARMVLEGARDYAIVTVDAEGKIIDWSKGAERMFRYAEEEVLGRHFDILFAPEDREHGVPADEMRRAREQDGAEDERWHVRKGGERFYASGILRYLQDEGDYYVKIARDLTERQQTEAAREALLARERAVRGEMEKASGQKDQFLATLSHELRNPLNLIQLQAEIILRSTKGTNPQLERAAQIIRQTVGTQAQLINDLFDTSRLQTGKFTLHQQLLPLTFVVADCLGAIRQDAASKQVAIEVDLTPEPLIVEADPVRVRQIVWNLLTNAVKFTSARGRVRVKLTKEADEARLEVSDNGAGIAPETLPHIYDMFLQADTGTTREHGGLGIGLALVKQLVEMHGGRIEAQSEGIGRGARFTVWLRLDKVAGPPAVNPEDMQRERKLSAQEAHPAMPPPEGKLAGLRVLVVDDTPENAESLGALLSLEGALVRIAMSAEEALLIAEQRDFDCIVSDIAMPNMDGHALLTELRRRPRTKTTRAIALTGYDRAADAAKAKDAGFDEHVAKPADIEQLVDMILRLGLAKIHSS